MLLTMPSARRPCSGDLFEIAGQHCYRLVNLSTLFVAECIDRWSGGFL